MTSIKKCILTVFFLLFSCNLSSAQISWKEIFPWEVLNPEGTDFYALNSLSSSDIKNTTIAGYIFHSLPFPNAHCSHLILRTTNGGISWNEQNSGLPFFFDQTNSITIKKVYSIDSLNVVAVGDSGLILRTTDGGNTWLNQGKHLRTRYVDVSFSDPDHGIAVGTWGTVAITSDGGKNWNVHELFAYSTFNIAKAYGNGLYYAFDKNYQHFFRTKDAGVTWDSIQIVDKSLKNNLPAFIRGIYFFDSLNFIAVGGHQDPQGAAYHYYAIKTTDGGNNWDQLIDSSSLKGPLLSVSFLDGNTGVASAANGNLMFTTNGGSNWTSTITDSLNTASFVSVSYLNKKQLYILSGNVFYSSLLLATLSAEGVADNKPRTESIVNNYPNPLNSITTISYNLNAESVVHCFIQDILGREVQRIDLGHQESGEHSFTFNASQLPVGSYYYTIEAEGKRMTKQMVIMR